MPDRSAPAQLLGPHTPTSSGGGGFQRDVGDELGLVVGLVVGDGNPVGLGDTVVGVGAGAVGVTAAEAALGADIPATFSAWTVKE